MDTIKKNCPTWDCAEKAVQPNVLTNKIVADKFNQADDKTRKIVLNAAFGMAFEKVAGNVNHNFTCFNADHEDRTPSMVFDKAKGHFHCFGCMDYGENFDGFDVIGAAYGFTSFKDCYSKAVELFVDNPSAVIPNERPKGDLFPKAMYRTLKNPFYTPIQNDPDGLAYLKSRGISRNTAVKHGVMTWEYEGWLFLVFVNDNGSVVRRRFAKTADAAMYANQPDKWWNQKGQGGYFNLRAVEKAKEKNEIVFVTESAIDALTVLECGYHAVGLNSVNRLSGMLQESNYPYLVGLFDNDDIGRNKAALFKQRGFCVAEYDEETTPFLRQYKDVNEALTANETGTLADLAMLNYCASVQYGLN